MPIHNSSQDSSSIKSKNGDTSQITYIWMTLVWLCDPQDTTMHLPSPCLPVTSFLRTSDAAKSAARTLESIPTEMLTQSCTECRENGWLAQGKHNVLPDSQFYPTTVGLRIYYFMCVRRQCGIWASSGEKGREESQATNQFPPRLIISPSTSLS